MATMRNFEVMSNKV